VALLQPWIGAKRSQGVIERNPGRAGPWTTLTRRNGVQSLMQASAAHLLIAWVLCGTPPAVAAARVDRLAATVIVALMGPMA